MFERLVNYLLQSLLHFKIGWFSSYISPQQWIWWLKREQLTLAKVFKRQSIISFSSCIHTFQDFDLYNNVLIPCAWNKKTCFLSWITICMIYHYSCIDTRFEKQKPWHHEQANIFMHHTSSTIVSSEGINLQKSSWDFSNWGSSSKTYISSKPSFVLAHQAEFRTSPSSPILSGPPTQFRTGPPSLVSYWPLSLVLSGPPSPVPYWPIKPNFV